MKQPSKDPFEVAFDLEENYDEEEEEPPPPPPSQSSSQPSSQQQLNPQNQQQQQQQQVEEEDEQEEVSPSESPIRADEIVTETQTNSSINIDDEFNTNNPQSSTILNNNNNNNNATSNKKRKLLAGQASTSGKNKDDDDDEEEENMEVELGKFTSSGDPDKMAKMQAILSQLTEEQMSRYESFRRSGFQKANMKKLLASITGSPKISVPMTIVVSGIAKMFVGELVETGRIIMTERGETGPIRPCHIREAYRRLKLEGKVPKKSVPRLFR